MCAGSRPNFWRAWFATVMLGLAALVCLALLAAPMPLSAQGGEGTISGTVNDTTGAVVPGATVTLINTATGEKRSVVSNGAGFFAFVAVPPATYNLTIAMKGFERFEHRNITLHALDKIGLTDLVLKAGAATQTVEVSAAATNAIPTDTGEKTATIEAKQVQNLAIVGRSAVELLKILPGVVDTNSGVEPGRAWDGETMAFNQGVGSYHVNGARSDALAIVNDGADTIDPGCNCGSSVTPNVDMIQEVKVQTANFSAENAQGPMVIQTVDKSGTAALHGEAYYDLRNPGLNANDPQNIEAGFGRPNSKYQYPGFNVGGPVLIPGTGFNKHRDKMFFFAGFEWMRQGVDLGLKKAVVPTPEMLNGNFNLVRACPPGAAPGSASCSSTTTVFAPATYNMGTLPCQPGANSGGLFPYCSGNYQVDMTQKDPGFSTVMGLYPRPNLNPITQQGFNYASDLINPQNRNQQLVRIDYNFSQNTKLYSRFNHEGETEPYPYGLWWNESAVPYPSNVLGANHSDSLSSSLTSVFDPTLTNELTVAVTRLDLPNTMANPAIVSRSANHFNHGIFTPADNLFANMTGWDGSFDMINPGGYTPTLFANKWVNSIGDNLSKVAGNHLIKMGVYYEHLTNDQPTSASDQGDAAFANWGFQNGYGWGARATGNAYADMLLGYVANWDQTSPNITGHMAQNELEGYVQDSWKVKPRLTLDLGARLYHEGWMYDTLGRIGVFNPSAFNYGAAYAWACPGAGACVPGKDATNSGTFPGYTGIESNQTSSSVPRSGFTTPALKIAPHFGFAWDLTGKASTVLRGGFGTYYYRDQGNVFFGAISNPPFMLGTSVCCAQQMDTWDKLKFSPQPTSLNVLDPLDKHVPVTYSYSLTLSKRMPWASTGELSYVGNVSHNQVQPSGFNINVVPQGAEFADLAAGNLNPGNNTDEKYRPWKTYQTVAQTDHVLSQNYNSLQATWSKQTGIVNYAASYQFGKTLGYGGDYYAGATSIDFFDARGRSYGVLPYSRTHQFKIAYTVFVPAIGSKFLGNHTATNAIFNGWQASGITTWETGPPMQPIFNNMMTNRDIAGTPDTTVHPLLTCDPRSGLTQARQLFNPNCFQAPSIGKNGVYQMPFITGPGFNQSDLSVFKNFQVGSDENRKLQLRFEAFNFLNHPLWGYLTGVDPNLKVNFANSTGNCTIFGHSASPCSGGQGIDPAEVAANPNIGVMDQLFGHRILQVAAKFFF
jgi:hypothetical protein